MRTVLIVQVSRDGVVLMIAMRNGLVSAVRTVRMRLIVFTAGVTAIATLRIRGGDADDVLVDVLLVRVMQVAVVQIVDVPFVTNGRVTAP
jgi:hypothetical protein